MWWCRMRLPLGAAGGAHPSPFKFENQIEHMNHCREADHVVVPDAATLAALLEVFEVPDMVDFLLLSSVLQQVRLVCSLPAEEPVDTASLDVDCTCICCVLQVERLLSCSRSPAQR